MAGPGNPAPLLLRFRRSNVRRGKIQGGDTKDTKESRDGHQEERTGSASFPRERESIMGPRAACWPARAENERRHEEHEEEPRSSTGCGEPKANRSDRKACGSLRSSHPARLKTLRLLQNSLLLFFVFFVVQSFGHRTITASR